MEGPLYNRELARLVAEEQEARSAFDSARSNYEYRLRQMENAQSDMEVARILGIIRTEALRSFNEQHAVPE